MNLQLGKRFWIVVTSSILLFTFFVVGRNALHAVRIKRQIRALTRERDAYKARIAADSILLEQLKYDDFLEEYAREQFRMQRRDEQVYIVE